MTKEQAILAAKTFRKEADDLLQRMKDHSRKLKGIVCVPTEENHQEIDDRCEVIAQHTLSIRDLESCIMRQGMVLKYIGTPDPYPNSKNPSNTIVEPTADGLKL